MFQLTKKRPGVYLLSFDSHIDLCYAFMRYQELYESPRFQGQAFTWPTYMRWYMEKNLKQGGSKHAFYYAADWAGFNHPVDVIKQVHDLGIPDPNEYDELMMSVYKLIMRDEAKAYLIGAPPGSNTEKHELTHAMWYLNDGYKKKATNFILPLHSTTKHETLVADLKTALFNLGYTESTAIDEINAFITTGEGGHFAAAAKKHKKEMESLRKMLKELHKKFYPDFTKDMK